MSRSSKILSLCLEPNEQHEQAINESTLLFESTQKNTLEAMHKHNSLNKENVYINETFENISNLPFMPIDLELESNFNENEQCLQDWPVECNPNGNEERLQDNLSEEGETDDSVKDPNYDTVRKKNKKNKVVPHRRSSSSSSSTSSSSSSRSSSSSSSSNSSSPSSSILSPKAKPNEDIHENRPSTSQLTDLDRNHPQVYNELSEEMPPSRKKPRVERRWKQNVTKVLRNSGLPYQTKSGRNIPKKSLKEVVANVVD